MYLERPPLGVDYSFSRVVMNASAQILSSEGRLPPKPNSWLEQLRTFLKQVTCGTEISYKISYKRSSTMDILYLHISERRITPGEGSGRLTGFDRSVHK